ncbi:hypothetical protein I3W98_32725, partial [Streptomyces cavourensis]|nr:hypothetical protein [Streptomyces cavourensis]
MTEQSEWRFSDDRGQLSTAPRRPGRVLAYVQGSLRYRGVDIEDLVGHVS